MSIANYIKQIGRGTDGARALDAVQAEDLMQQIFAGRVSDLQLGAFVIAMRIKGESAAELAGFLAATQVHMAPEIIDAVQCSTQPVVWLPSYNGAHRLPNLTALLAGLLARQGLSVIVHGPASDPARVTSHAVFDSFGWPMLASAGEAAAIPQVWQQQRPVFIPVDALCPRHWRACSICGGGSAVPKPLQAQVNAVRAMCRQPLPVLEHAA